MQILQRVLPGVIIPGDEHLPAIGQEARRQSNVFTDLHNDDALWAYACRMSLDFNVWRVADHNDLVMIRLFRMGLYDWKDVDNRLNQTTPVSRLHFRDLSHKRTTLRLYRDILQLSRMPPSPNFLSSICRPQNSSLALI